MENNKAEIAKAIIKVMQAVKGIEKSMTVGKGSNAYQGVSDKDVKLAIGKAMEDNGLCIVPIDINAKTQIDRWEETTNYNNTPETKTKQSVFTEVVSKYLLLHISGESLEISGYGHGVDSQDKSAGKATTYALKNALLYLFMVPTGKIEDADTEHSDDKPVPQGKTYQESNPAGMNKPNGAQVDTRAWLNPGTPVWDAAIKYLQQPGAVLSEIDKNHKISAVNRQKLIEAAQEALSV